ncbi:acyl-CoA synthetase [Nocardia sp. NPDC003999]
MHNKGIGSWTARRELKSPHRVAVGYRGKEWTYRQLHERVLRLAHGLRDLGVQRGDRVAYLGPNHPAFLEMLFATGTLGAVFVPVNMRLAGPELGAHLDDSGACVLVYSPEQAAVVQQMRGQLTISTLVALDSDYEPMLARSPAEPIDEPVSLNDPCVIMYTSGTSGRTKGAVLTHGNIMWNSINVLVDADLASDEVALVVAPLYHTASLNMTCLPTLLKGGRVLLESAFDPERALNLIAAQRVTFMFAVPAMFHAIASSAQWPTADLSSLRTLVCGGAPVPDTVIRTYLERGLFFIQGYGMTETAAGALLLDRSEVLAKAGSAGAPHFFTDVRVVRPDLADCAPGEKGEVIIQGPNVMAGYWGQPAATAQPLTEGGWFHSGDVAVTDEDGHVYVIDRMKDMIISGGENIYPAEVEKVLGDHPAVADVALIGMPEEKWGEVGLALVVLKPGARADEADLHGFLLDRIAKYKLPKSYRFVAELPRSAAGKLLKTRLRGAYTGKKESSV